MQMAADLRRLSLQQGQLCCVSLNGAKLSMHPWVLWAPAHSNADCSRVFAYLVYLVHRAHKIPEILS